MNDEKFKLLRTRKSTYIDSLKIEQEKSVPARDRLLSVESRNGAYKVRSELLKDLLQRSFNLKKNNLNFKDTNDPDFATISKSYIFSDTFAEFKHKLPICTCMENDEGLKDCIMYK